MIQGIKGCVCNIPLTSLDPLFGGLSANQKIIGLLIVWWKPEERCSLPPERYRERSVVFRCALHRRGLREHETAACHSFHSSHSSVCLPTFCSSTLILSSFPICQRSRKASPTPSQGSFFLSLSLSSRLAAPKRQRQVPHHEECVQSTLDFHCL